MSLLRYTVGTDDELVPYADRVQERYAGWLPSRSRPASPSPTRRGGGSTAWSTSSPSSAGITADDLDDAPFTERGGIDGALRDLGDRAGDLLDELNEELTA